MVLEEYVENIIKEDRKIFYEDLNSPSMEYTCHKNIYPMICDFTEYSPLHNGHLYCMLEAKRLHPEALFVAVIPGLFERNGRGLPYIMNRYTRAKIATSVGADIVVEGPPMGIMGSGQYSLCLSSMFKALNADFIPRGYISSDPKFKIILDYINNGKAVAPKPYKIISVEDKKVLLEGKLSNDDYVIVSLSKSLTKVGFDYKDKFIFIPRIEGVSGTQIREDVTYGNYENISNMLPKQTIKILDEEIKNQHAPLHNIRAWELLLRNVNTLNKDRINNLTLIDDKTKSNIINHRPFKTNESLENSIEHGFSRHQKNRILSVLEANILSEEVHKYINSYPQKIRILGYKNKDVLNKFKTNLKNNNLIGVTK